MELKLIATVLRIERRMLRPEVIHGGGAPLAELLVLQLAPDLECRPWGTHHGFVYSERTLSFIVLAGRSPPHYESSNHDGHP